MCEGGFLSKVKALLKLMRMNVGKQLIKVIDDKRSRFERLDDLFVFFCQYPIQSPVFVNSMVDDPLLAFLWLSIPNG